MKTQYRVGCCPMGQTSLLFIRMTLCYWGKAQKTSSQSLSNSRAAYPGISGDLNKLSQSDLTWKEAEDPMHVKTSCRSVEIGHLMAIESTLAI